MEYELSQKGLSMKNGFRRRRKGSECGLDFSKVSSREVSAQTEDELQ